MTTSDKCFSLESTYEEVAAVFNLAYEALLQRLQWMTIQPARILEIGGRALAPLEKLRKNYPQSIVFSLKRDGECQVEEKERQSIRYICGEAVNIPLFDQTVDILIANFFLPWENDFVNVLREWRRVLRVDGMLILTALGPDTLKEWRGLLSNQEIPQFIDMHNLGDLLLETGFTGSVLEVDHYTLSYQSKQKMVKELLLTDMWFPEKEAAIELLLANEVFAHLNLNKVTYEVVLAHAFAAQDKPISEEGTVNIPIDLLRQQLRKMP